MLPLGCFPMTDSVSLRAVLQGLDWSVLTDLLISVIPALICICVHELCHGLAAYALGDDTAKRSGRLSLNPLRHIDVWGLVMLVVCKFGWAKPVPVNMYRFRDPKRGMALTALAGPVSNLVLAVVIMFLRGVFTSRLPHAVLQLCDLTAYLSICLGIFNFIPVPPLDGSKVLFALLPDEMYYKLMRYERYGMILLIILLVSGVVSEPLSRVTGSVFNTLFYSIAQAGFDLASKFIG